MDQRIRLLTAAAVMLSGLGFALFFRRPAAENDVPIPLQSDPLVLRKQPDPRAIAGPETLPAAAQSRRALPTIVAPSNQAAVPPELARTYPDRYSNSGQIVSTRWGASLEEMLPEATSAPATHKVIDGDSLALLALRYLGSASRAMEIYEANRNVLAQPEILPIGAELKIPRGGQGVSPKL